MQPNCNSSDPATAKMPPAPPLPPASQTSFLLLHGVALGTIPVTYKRCLPSISCNRLYLHFVFENATAPRVSQSVRLAKRLHGIGGGANTDLRIFYHAFKALPQLPSPKIKCDSLLTYPGLSPEMERKYQLALETKTVTTLALAGDEVKDGVKDGSDKDNDDDRTFDNVVLGGTFDRLHAGHKIMLTEAVLRCKKRLTIGVTDETMLASKILPELILPCQTRIAELRDYLSDCDPTLHLNIVPISDPFGPSIVEEDLLAIIGSEETRAGCLKVNEKRQQKGLSKLEVLLVAMEPSPTAAQDHEDAKISSSTARIRLLGTMLRPPLKAWSPLDGTPYVIGLTGGSASGKSSVAKRLAGLGAGVVDCDVLGHKAYEVGTDCYNKVVEAFGKEVVNATNQSIDRKVLGSKVFGSSDNKTKLESIVWPEILKLAQAEIKALQQQGRKVIVLDAAVLLSAGWHKELCHQVWSCIVTREEAIKRIEERDKKTKEEADQRLKAQMSNREVVAQSNVVFCTMWEGEFTQKQVEKAWKCLQQTMSVPAHSAL